MNNIYALSTPIGKSGVAIIRISGKSLQEILPSLGIEQNLKNRYAHLRQIYHPVTKDLIDNILIIWFESPNSFTGEDIIEIHCHGSKSIISTILEALSQIKDMRLAEPGEFSKRAFLNNKIDLTEAEALEDLINSETRAQSKQALRQMSGELGKIYEAWRKTLIRILALIEAYIDFPDEDLPSSIIDEINQTIDDLKKDILLHVSDNRRGEKLREGLFITIIGAPNVGKSSLLNFLAKKDIAIVSDIPGTTRDIIEVALDIKGVPIIIADTAGIRETSDFIESEGIKRAYAHARMSDYKIIMFDATSIDNVDSDIVNMIDDETIILVNKIDMNNKNFDEIKNIKPIYVSLKENIGTEEFLNKLEEIASDIITSIDSLSITRARYRMLLVNCLESLDKFSLDDPIELCAEELRIAASYIGQITGKIDIEAILDEIFSSFCIGK